MPLCTICLSNLRFYCGKSSDVWHRHDIRLQENFSWLFIVREVRPQYLRSTSTSGREWGALPMKTDCTFKIELLSLKISEWFESCCHAYHQKTSQIKEKRENSTRLCLVFPLREDCIVWSFICEVLLCHYVVSDFPYHLFTALGIGF